MADTFRIIGDEIHFGPHRVGTLSTAIPATVRDYVEELLDGTSRMSYDLGYDDATKEYAAEYDNGYKDGHAAGMEEVKPNFDRQLDEAYGQGLKDGNAEARSELLGD